MKRYHELSEAEQTKAVDRLYCDLLKAVTEGAIRFNDDANEDDLQSAIDKAAAEADRMQTPWFAHEYIAEAEYTEFGVKRTVEDTLRGMAQCEAEDALYSQVNEWVLAGIAA